MADRKAYHRAYQKKKRTELIHLRELVPVLHEIIEQQKETIFLLECELREERQNDYV